MRWLSRRTATPGRHAAGRHSAAAGPAQVGQAAPVPALAAPAPAPVEEPAPVNHATPVPTVVRPAAMPIPVAESGVHLGFADGSVLELAATDPRANTFRALARTLTQGHR